MLQPKRVKYRNKQRGRRKGMAVAGSTISFGEYGLKATEAAWVTSRQIEAARRVITRYAPKGRQDLDPNIPRQVGDRSRSRDPHGQR